MEIPRNRFKRALGEGRRQIGFWLSLGSDTAAEIVAGAGYDFVTISAWASTSRSWVPTRGC